MSSFKQLFSTATALSLAALTQGRPLVEERADCNCYKATADSSAYFANRKFFDFRNIANPVTTDPINGVDADGAAGKTHEYFSSDEWTSTFSIQTWATEGEGVYRQNSANNVLIAPADGEDAGVTSYLTMRTQRNADYQSTSEVESISQGYQYLTARMLARTRGDAGACTALFTYKGEPLQEGDIEILTKEETNVVHYTNQPGDTEGATSTVELATPWTEWQEHRYDWTPGSSDWYLDGEKVASIQLQTPTDPLGVIMNVWSNGGVWTGVMDVGNAAEMQVQWLDISYNSTETGSSSCSSVCAIDDLI